MSELETIIGHAIRENNVDLMLPKILETTFYMVCERESEDAAPEIYLVPSQNPDQLCISVSEDADLLEDFLESNPRIVLAEISGDQLLGLVEEKHEIMIMFKDGLYCLSRAHIDWWYADEPEEVQS